MKILLLLSGGWGNVTQTTPMYLALRKEHEVDVEYLPQYDGESVRSTQTYPNPIIQETNLGFLKLDTYDYVVKTMPLRIYNGEGGFVREYEDMVRENDTEFESYMRVLDFFKVKRKIERKWREKECAKPQKYICMHNGGLNVEAWQGKKYPKFAQLAYLVQTRLGIPVVSIGLPQESIGGTVERCSQSMRESAYLLRNSLLNVTTDTGSMHLSALMERPTVAIFTMTDTKKNYDKRFHKTVTTIQREDLDCCPCQWGNCHSPTRPCKGQFWCQDIKPEAIFEVVEKMLCQT